MSSTDSSWYSISNINELDSPALVVYPDRVKQNIQTAIQMIGDVNRLRPHIKTNKSLDVSMLMIEAGIRKFKCATIAEAEMLAMAKAPDVLLAYQPVGPKLDRFVALIKKYPVASFSCLVDNEEAAKEMAALFNKNHLTVPVYLDLNVGQNRTGIEPGIGALQLYKLCAGLKGIRPVGLHAYDGHIRDIDWNARKENCDKAFATVEQLKNEIVNTGLAEPILVIGGTPTYSIHCKRKNIECSPGTFIYWDKGYIDLCPEQSFVPAALVVSRVISLPANKICVDLGHKSIAAENELSRRVYFLNAPDLKFVGQSEEHLVAEPQDAHSYRIHDVFFGLPFHICPTVALYERAYTVNDHVVNGEWKTTARDKKITV